jgi:hypothetical protein
MAAKAPPDRGSFVSDNVFDSLGEEEAGEITKNVKSPKSKAKKVKYSPWEFSPTLFEDKPKSHEGKYVIIETTTGAKLTEMSVFTAETIIRHIAPNYVSADKMRDGKILVLTKDERSAKHALTITEVKGICQVKVTEHGDLNQVRDTIYCEELKNENVEEIKERLKTQKVTDV